LLWQPLGTVRAFH